MRKKRVAQNKKKDNYLGGFRLYGKCKNTLSKLCFPKVKMHYRNFIFVMCKRYW